MPWLSEFTLDNENKHDIINDTSYGEDIKNVVNQALQNTSRRRYQAQAVPGYPKQQA